jgi:hypothetical protein
MSADWQLTYDVGHEHNPSNPFGKTVLTVGGDGALRLEQRIAGAFFRTWTGRLEPSVVDELRGHLGRAGFPAGAQQVFAAGTPIMLLRVREGGAERAVEIGYYAAEKMAGYADLVKALDSVSHQLSGGGVDRGPNRLPPVVHDAKLVDRSS